jgi:hypothetical protein
VRSAPRSFLALITLFREVVHQTIIVVAQLRCIAGFAAISIPAESLVAFITVGTEEIEGISKLRSELTDKLRGQRRESLQPGRREIDGGLLICKRICQSCRIEDSLLRVCRVQTSGELRQRVETIERAEAEERGAVRADNSEAGRVKIPVVDAACAISVACNCG